MNHYEDRFSLFDRILQTAALVCFSAHLVSALIFHKALYADGAGFFIGATTHIFDGWSWWWYSDTNHLRLYIDIINQLPLKMAVSVGVTDLRWLRLAFGAPLYLNGLIVLGWTLLVCRRHQCAHLFTLALATHILFIVPSEIFAINQARLSMDIYWLLLVYILSPAKLSKTDVLVTALFLPIIFKSHETIIPCGAIIFAISIIQWRRKVPDWGIKLVIGGAVASACAFGIYWQMTHPVAAATSGYLRTITYFSFKDLFKTPLGFAWFPACMIFVFGIRYTDARFTSTRSRAIFWCLLGLPVVLGFLPLANFKYVQPTKEFGLRVLITAGGCGVMVFAAILHLKQEFGRLKLKSIFLILCATVIGESVWQMSMTARWNEFSKGVSYVTDNSPTPVATREQVDAYLKANSAEKTLIFEWGWAYPVLGLALGSSRSVSTVIRPLHHLEWFKISLSGSAIGRIPFQETSDKYFDFSPFKR
ncbi:MAG: hypothetical protein EOP06_07680, partial [Proteobacteria bacterium]